MLKCCFTTIVLFILSYGYPQEDSIKILQKQLLTPKNDSEKIEIFIKQSTLYLRADKASATFAAKAFKLSEKNNSNYLKSKSMLAFANAERFSDNINVLFSHETQATALAKKSGNTFLVFDCLNACANDLISVLKLPEASAIIDKAGALDAVANNDYKAKLLCTKASYQFKLQKSMADMKAYLTESLQLANQQSDAYLAAKDKLQLFTAMLYSGQRDSAVRYLFEALDFFEHNNYRELKASCLLELAKSYTFQANFTKSNEYCDSAYAIMNSMHNELGAANAQTTLFQNYLTQQKFNAALKAATLIKHHSAIINNPEGLALADILLAAANSALGNYVLADRLFKQSDSTTKELNILLLTTALNMYKAVHREREKKYTAADSVALKGYESGAKSMNKELTKSLYSSGNKTVVLSKNEALDKRLYQDSNFRKKYGKQALLALREKNDSSASDIFNPILSAVDKSLTETYNNQVLDLDTKYKTSKINDSLQIEKQRTLLSAATLKKQSIIIVSVAVIALLLAIGFLLQYKNKQRAIKDKAKIEMLQNEIHHRVKNNLGSIKRFAAIAEQSGNESLSLSSLKNRITAIELLHKNLYQSSIAGEISLQKYISELAKNSSDAFSEADKNIQFKINTPVTVNMQMAEKIGLIINELVTNSFKYGFKNRTNGEIQITAQQTGNKKIILTYKENGVGYNLQNTVKGYGTKLIEGISNELNAAVEMKTDNGIHFILTV